MWGEFKGTKEEQDEMHKQAIRKDHMDTRVRELNCVGEQRGGAKKSKSKPRLWDKRHKGNR